MDLKLKERRERVIARLKEQLKKGVKTNKDLTLDLTPTDVARINKEIEILSQRV
jgi:hypothetical protein